MIGQQVQSYRIVRQLGAGGMGVVYEAEDTRLGRRVALKFLPASLSDDASADAAARFEREARLLSSLNHPNICTIHDIGSVGDGSGEQRFIVMELLEGESLRSRIHGQPLPIDLVVDIGTQLADALEAAHDKGIVHRDIKPANIFVTKRGQAKLLDFGIAKLGVDAVGEDAETRQMAEQLTVAGTTVGSINYMSPEQARGQEIDGRSDIFSLGLVLYEMATGRQAFSGPTSAVVYDAILNRDPAPANQVNAAVPPDLDRVIARAIEKDPKLRYQTAGDLLAELRRVRRDTDTRRPAATDAQPAAAVSTAPTAVPSVPASAAARTTRRSRWAIVGAAGLLTIGLAGFLLWNSTRTAAFTERDLVLVADFVNSTGDSVFDDALKQAVSVQLQQTAFVTLLSDQQVQTTLALMRRPAEEAVTGAVAREICQRAGARATVEGSIAPLGSAYVISLGVHDCQTGAAIAQGQNQADSKEGVLKAVGATVTTLRERLGESLASIKKNDVPVEATTSSLEALRAYGQGLKARATKPDEAAIPFLQQAIDKDPDFASAYARLGIVYSNVARPADARIVLQHAFDLRDRVSEYERLYIQWAYYTRGEPDDAKAKQALDLLAAQYPRDFATKNNLGIYYGRKGQFEEAAAQYQAAHDLAPDEPLPMQNLSSALFNLGRYDEAMKFAEDALAIRPAASVATNRWIRAHLQYDPREAAFKDVAVKQATADAILQNEMAMALWDGRWAAYLESHRKLIEFYRVEKRETALANAEATHAINAAIFEGGAAVTSLKSAVNQPGASSDFVRQAAVALAILGDPSVLRREIARIERDEAPAPGAPPSANLGFARALQLAADGKTDQAIATLQTFVTQDPRQAGTYTAIAQIQERAGRIDDAIASHRRVVDAAPALVMSNDLLLSRLALARLLTTKGDAAGAKTHVDALSKQWAQADASFLPAQDLKRLAK